MAAIDGITGNVVFAAGYTTNVHMWNATDSANSIDTTPFAPAGNSRTRITGLGEWSGTYACWQPATISTTLTVAGALYVANAHAYSVNITAEDLPTTPFGVSYRTRIAGLLSADGSYDCWLDDTVALPTNGSTDTLTITSDAGDTLVVPIVVISANPRVSADGSDREVTINWESNGDFVEAGNFPVIAATGNAEFIAQGGREYVGTILITGISITHNAARDTGDWTFTWVGVGPNAAA